MQAPTYCRRGAKPMASLTSKEPTRSSFSLKASLAVSLSWRPSLTIITLTVRLMMHHQLFAHRIFGQLLSFVSIPMPLQRERLLGRQTMHLSRMDCSNYCRCGYDGEGQILPSRRWGRLPAVGSVVGVSNVEVARASRSPVVVVGKWGWRRYRCVLPEQV